MEITFHGNSCFRIKGKDAVVVVNPEKNHADVQGDIVISNLSQQEELRESTKTFSWPGEYEANEVPILGLNVKKKDGSFTTVFCFAVDRIRFCHLGETDLILEKETLNDIGDVDVLFLNVSAEGPLSAKIANELLELIEPRALAIYGDDNSEVTPILREIGLEKLEKEDKFVLKSAAGFPEDQRVTIALNRK